MTYSEEYATAQLKSVMPHLQSTRNALSCASHRVVAIRKYQDERPAGERWTLSAVQRAALAELAEFAEGVSAEAAIIARVLTACAVVASLPVGSPAAETPPCLGCGKPFEDVSKRWAIVFDPGDAKLENTGGCYIMVEWVMTMAAGPYHGGPCISAALEARIEAAK